MTAQATIREASGRVVGPLAVHGAGGPLQERDRRRLEKALERATAGKRLVDLAELAPGHVRAYRHTAQADLDGTLIDLRGAVLLAWEP